MIFSSLLFIFIFLPVTLILYYVSPWKFKNLILLIMSLIFYAWGEPIYILVMMISIVFNYFSALQMDLYGRTRQSKKQKTCFIATVAVNLAMLCFFKYLGFFLGNLNAIFGSSFRTTVISLPIGISFYTFQTLSYIIDVYWGNVRVQKNIIDFGAYISMFPQLIAGPIVRYKDIAAQLKQRTISFEQISDGVSWFIRGLAKKVLLANNIGMLYDAVFAVSAADRAVLTTWLGIIAYTFQIYFDFSGYSDMAIGLGKMLGFQFVKNFDYPYISGSATEFWRRWHISLGTWFREYVYIPLGGNRVSVPKHIFNILVVWLLTGFWHGASWAFVLWGLYWAVLLLLERYVYGRLLDILPAVVRHIYTVLAFIIGWLIFTSSSVAGFGQNLSSMFGGTGTGFADARTGYYFGSYIILLIICGFCCTPVVWKGFRKIAVKQSVVCRVVTVLSYTVLFGACIASLVNASYNPFLYFRF